MRSIPGLNELNKVAQKPDYKTKGNWMARNITREMALPITWLLLHTPISANGVTLISFIIGMAACLVFSFGTNAAMLAAATLLQIWYLFDHVDGQIARYRRESSLTGIFFDYITHHIIHISIFIGIGWGVYLLSSDVMFILAGIITGLNILVLNIVYDCEYKTFFHAMVKKIVPKSDANGPLPQQADKAAGKSAARKIFSFIHKLCEVHVVMNIVTGLAVTAFLFRDFYIWDKFLILYLVISAIAGITKVSYFIVKGVPDKEYPAFMAELKERRFSE